VVAHLRFLNAPVLQARLAERVEERGELTSAPVASEASRKLAQVERLENDLKARQAQGGPARSLSR